MTGPENVRYPGRSPHPAWDPYYNLGRWEITTLRDVGVRGMDLLRWEEVEDFDEITPPRPRINGRKDYTPRTPTTVLLDIARLIDEQEVHERDLIDCEFLARWRGVPLEQAEAWSRTRGFPRIQGFTDQAMRGRTSHHKFTPFYDRVDVIDWVEENLDRENEKR